MPEEEKAFESWGMLELFGHQRLAGKLSEAVVGGCHFLRIDVPAVGAVPEYTRFFTQGAIYCMTPMAEPVARRLAANLQAVPVHAYDLRPPEPTSHQLEFTGVDAGAARRPPGDRDDLDDDVPAGGTFGGLPR